VNATVQRVDDGAHSDIRRRLEIVWTGETGVVRDFFGDRMYAIYVRSPQFYDVVPHPPAWMNVTFNSDRRAFMAAVDGTGELAFHTQLREGEDRSEQARATRPGCFSVRQRRPAPRRRVLVQARRRLCGRMGVDVGDRRRAEGGRLPGEQGRRAHDDQERGRPVRPRGRVNSIHPGIIDTHECSAAAAASRGTRGWS
jgi:hypothetical protein